MSATSIRHARTGAMIIAMFSMIIATLFVAPPSADAQESLFSRDLLVETAAEAGVPCDPIGTITDPAATSQGDYCRPVGFAPVTSLAICQEASELFGILFLFDTPTSTCFVDGIPTSNPCEPPTVSVDGTDQVLTTGSPFVLVGCGFPLLSADVTVEPPPEPPSMGGFQGASAVACIESDAIQSDPGAAELGMGSVFLAQTGFRTLIIAGEPTCEAIGDGCDASLNLFEVSAVGTCLAALAAEDAIPAAEVNPSVPAVQPVVAEQSVAVEQLALTGEEHEFGAAFAGALVGTGLSVLAFGRLLHMRRKEH